MDQKTVEKLEENFEEINVQLGLDQLPLMPDRRTRPADVRR